jgi:hypothetical protein
MLLEMSSSGYFIFHVANIGTCDLLDPVCFAVPGLAPQIHRHVTSPTCPPNIL